MKALIVGGGIAGLCSSLELQKHGIHCTLIDQGKNESSACAAGMINPIVFRRTTKSWRADEFLPYLRQYYQNLEVNTKSSFFHPLTVRRIFSSEQEKNEWLKKEVKPEYVNYLEVIDPNDSEYNLVQNPYGTGRVKQCFWVDPHRFIASCIEKLEKTGQIKTELFDYSSYDADSRKYQGERYDIVIFCEGYLVKDNPLFCHLPIGATKGQILTIETSILPSNESLNRKCFVLPIGQNKFKIGSTYEWNATNSACTDEGKQVILDNYSVLITDSPKIIEHTAGLRPTTLDRRPFMGEHNEKKGNFILNGLGAKGYMLAPLLAKELIDFILFNKPLHSETTLNRI